MVPHIWISSGPFLVHINAVDRAYHHAYRAAGAEFGDYYHVEPAVEYRAEFRRTATEAEVAGYALGRLDTARRFFPSRMTVSPRDPLSASGTCRGRSVFCPGHSQLPFIGNPPGGAHCRRTSDVGYFSQAERRIISPRIPSQNLSRAVRARLTVSPHCVHLASSSPHRSTSICMAIGVCSSLSTWIWRLR